MGYRGKIEEQNLARELRAQGYTYNEIALELGVSKSSVSLWCGDVLVDQDLWSERVRRNKNYGARNRRPHAQAVAKQAQIERLYTEAREQIGAMSDRDLLIAGVALYAGEGSKTDGAVGFANSDPRMVALFLRFLRRYFQIDESRLRMRLYLHEGLDLAAAVAFWSQATAIPPEQFGKAYRAEPDPSIRKAKHVMGCPSVKYSCVATHRAVMGLVAALLSEDAWPSDVSQPNDAQ